MSYSDDLFNLIHSLTRQEKRYFRLFTALQKGEKNYVRLFDAITEQSEYNEEELRERFKGERFARNIHVAKRYLFNLILKALRSYGEGKRPHFQTKNLLRDVELLYEKGMPKAARKVLKKARELAEHHGDYVAMLPIIPIEEKLDEALGKNVSAEEFRERRQAILDRIARFSRLEYLNHAITETLALTSDYSKKMERLREIGTDPLLHSLPPGETVNYQDLYFGTRALYYFGLQNYEESLRQLLRCKELFDNDPALISRFPSSYIKLLGNIVTVVTRSGNRSFDHILSGFSEKGNEVVKASGIPPSLTGKLRIRLLRYRIVLHGRFGEPDRCIELTDEIEQVLSSSQSHGDWFDLAQIHYFLSWAWFIRGNFSSARTYEQRITISREPYFGKYFYYFLSLYRLILYFETGEIDQLETTMRRMERSFRRREFVPVYETLLHSFFKAHVRIADRHDRAEHFRELLREIRGVEPDEGSRHHLYYFNVEQWVAGKVERSSTGELRHLVPRRISAVAGSTQAGQ